MSEFYDMIEFEMHVEVYNFRACRRIPSRLLYFRDVPNLTNLVKFGTFQNLNSD